ncbi:biotin transporter BioY [Agromyces cerinus]|uniref:Biotin transport system substrate-specific component n=1 Tax=Agromyces cerinus subsp. cerinus TaxID=232089 RepID=A0A1N6DKF0_9MICO|nr:biotin transporter BioY [Agromyces cerinus]SIN71154.1 biotin transport system substrate-specific component [Agromyces cerinus subsp. cerinus]
MSSAHSTSTSSTSTTASNTTPPARPRRSSARDLAQIAVFAALIAALGLPGALTIGGTAVPITFQTLGVMLAGAILGARKGTLSVLLFIVLVAAGLPLLSGGRGGLGVFVGPSVGYLIGWLLGAAVIGWATARLLPRYPIAPALAWTALGGIVAIYLIGVPVFAAITGTPLHLAISGSALFLPGDLLKVVVTVLVAKGVHRAWPGLIEPRPWPWASRSGSTAGTASDSTASDRSA